LVDTAAPTSSATSPQYSTTNGFTVTYSANDPGSAASGVAFVDLYSEEHTSNLYSLIATDCTPPTPSISYTATEGDGNYSFYTRAHDKAGRYQPSSPTRRSSDLLVDTAAPTSSATSPQYSTTNGFTVTYSANDPGSAASGVAFVDL